MTLTEAQARRRVASTEWAALAAELDVHGSAPTGPLLTAAECRELVALYEKPELFRTTVDMARHRFGSGEYRYFTHDLAGSRRLAARRPVPASAAGRAGLGGPAGPSGALAGLPAGVAGGVSCGRSGPLGTDSAALRAGRLERPAP